MIEKQQLIDQAKFIQTEIEDLTRQIVRIQEEVNKKSEAIEALATYAKSQGWPSDEISENFAVKAVTKRKSGRQQSSKEDIALMLDAIEEMLRRRGEPMDVQTILRKLKDDGVPVPGKGETANIVVHLRNERNSHRFSPREYGHYGLTEWE